MIGRILIVEDSPSLALTFRLHLGGLGHAIFQANDGKEALELLTQQTFDLILLDLELPDMSGVDILRLVRGYARPPAVVVVTARSSAQQAEALVLEGAFDYLVKPFNGPRLVTTVNNALGYAALQHARFARPSPATRTHRYGVAVTWTGNMGSGTSHYRAYNRNHTISTPGRPPIPGSSDPLFLGDATRWNPEQLLVAAVSACHKLWYLHLCAEAGVVVTDYEDDAEGSMAETADGSGHFTAIVLHPRVIISPTSDPKRARHLHEAAHEKCFIANSLNFPVRCEALVMVDA